MPYPKKTKKEGKKRVWVQDLNPLLNHVQVWDNGVLHQDQIDQMLPLYVIYVN